MGETPVSQTTPVPKMSSTTVAKTAPVATTSATTITTVPTATTTTTPAVTKSTNAIAPQSKTSVDDLMKSQSTDSLIRDLAQAETLEQATNALENSESIVTTS